MTCYKIKKAPPSQTKERKVAATASQVKRAAAKWYKEEKKNILVIWCHFLYPVIPLSLLWPHPSPPPLHFLTAAPPPSLAQTPIKHWSQTVGVEMGNWPLTVTPDELCWRAERGRKAALCLLQWAQLQHSAHDGPLGHSLDCWPVRYLC